VIILDEKKTADHVNITLPPGLLDEWRKYANRSGGMLSPFIAAKMLEFIEEEKRIAELKHNKTFWQP